MTEDCDLVVDDGNYRCCWGDYENDFSDVVKQLHHEESMVDVTISADGEKIQAHKIVLSSCSPWFQELLRDVKDEHATIVIDGISAQDLKLIIEFVYGGQMHVQSKDMSSLLNTAKFLKISGLMDISERIIDVKDISKKAVRKKKAKEKPKEKVKEKVTEKVKEREKREPRKKRKQPETEETEEFSDKEDSIRKKKPRDYSEFMFSSAIEDLKQGMTLPEASIRNNIPKSTLYNRARSLGISMAAVRHEYPDECMNAAIEAVLGGCSLKHAAEIHNIPKTVLWRRMQKEGYETKGDSKRTYNTEKKELAIKALERGENLTKVATEYKIPKTTLFREKVRLVDEGKLPQAYWKKRENENGALKRLKLEQALNACKEGKMSQAAASMVYDIPKTTIWRNLQKENKEKKRNEAAQKASVNAEGTTESVQGFDMAEESAIPITYINESGMNENSLIILTPEDVENLNLGSGGQIIVNSDPVHGFVTCDMSIASAIQIES